MATSISDLLATLDHATQVSSINPGDAASAMHQSSRALSTIHAEGLGQVYPPSCIDSIRRLGEACAIASSSFDREPGRVADLTGVLADAIATLHTELADADRWVVATLLAAVTRRCANAIRSSGPYADVPELLSVLDRADELQQVATITPPDVDRIRGLDAPIPTTWRSAGLSADSAILDATAALAAQFRRRDRPPATVRELIAVCHVASHVAEHLGIDADTGERMSEVWEKARNTLTQYSDGIPLPPPGQPRSDLLLRAMAVETTVQRAGINATNQPAGHRTAVTAEASRQLQRLAAACRADLTKIAPTLIVLPGRAPISDDRAAEWLRREPFRVTAPDLQSGSDVLRQVSEAGAPRAGIGAVI